MTKIAVGHTAPDFRLKALDGKDYLLSALLERGPVVAAFFKISCPVCQFTFPFLERIHKHYAGDGVMILGISQDNPRNTKDFCQEFGITFPIVTDEKDYPVSNAYGLTHVPTIFLVDTGGKVKVSCMGFGKKDLETIAAQLAERRKMSRTPLFKLDEVIPANKPG